MKTPDLIQLSASATLTVTLRALSFFVRTCFTHQFILMQKQCLLPAQSGVIMPHPKQISETQPNKKPPQADKEDLTAVLHSRR
jgi:hypothetical protein